MPVIEQKEIRELLFKIGAPANTKGYPYLITAIEMVLKDGTISMMSELYPDIAEQHGAVSLKAVEKCIRYTVRETLANCPTEYLYDIFKGRERISNSKFISYISEYLKIKGGKNNE